MIFKKHHIKSIFIISLIFSLIVGSIIAYSKASDSSLWNDQNMYFNDDGSVTYITYDKIKTSSISYGTIGATVHQADAQGNEIDTAGTYATFDFRNQGTNVSYIAGESNPYGTVQAGYVLNTFTLPASYVKAQMDSIRTGWYEAVIAGEKVWENSIMTTYTTLSNGIKLAEGQMNPDGSYGTGVYDFSTISALLTRYGWADPSGIISHFHKYHVLTNDMVAEIMDAVAQIEGTGRLRQTGEKHTSGFGPQFHTWHTDNTYDVGEGIPSGKSMTNGIHVYSWYGKYAWIDSGLKKKDYTVPYEVHCPYTYTWTEIVGFDVVEDEHGQAIGKTAIEETFSETRWFVVSGEEIAKRSAEYLAIVQLDLRKFASAEVLNDSYGSTTYGAIVTPSSTAHINNEAVGSYMPEYVPNDDDHIEWPVEPSTQVRYAALDEFEPGTGYGTVSAAMDLPGDADEVVGLVTSWNDDLMVNGRTFMERGEVSAKHTESVYVSHADDLEYDDSDDIQSKRVGIPISKDNGKYPTTLNVTYARFMAPDGASETMSANGTEAVHCWEGDESSGDSVEGDATNERHEPVVVHTPVVSPVHMINASGGDMRQDANKTKTQMVLPTGTNMWNKPLVDEGIDTYDLLLDGTYTIKFDAYKWLSEQVREGDMSEGEENNSNPVTIENPDGKDGYDLPGYGESLYDEFTQKRKVRFPFDVAMIDKGTGEETYYFVQGQYTEWIDIEETEFKFYIPTWAKTTDEKFSHGFYTNANNLSTDVYKIQLHVEAYNTKSHTEDTEDLNNKLLQKYVATFDIPCSVSGIIYDFQVLGTNDRDMFEGYNTDIGISVDYGFSPTKQEKKTGVYNRYGRGTVRYTLDGLLTSSWNPRNTILMSKGSSLRYEDMGSFWKGTRFAYSVKTIANLSAESDYLQIRPRFRYLTPDGTSVLSSDQIKIYYTDKDQKYIEYLGDDLVEPETNGTLTPTSSAKDTRDLSNKKTFSFNNDQFFGSWYEGKKFLKGSSMYPSDLGDIPGSYGEHLYGADYPIPDDLAYTIQEYNEGRQVSDQIDKDKWYNKKITNYSLSDIKLTSQGRILSGNLDFLERNENYTAADSGYDTLANAFFKKSGATIPAYKSAHFRSSMQTWYGMYEIPSKLFVTPAEVDINGDGTKARLDSESSDPGYNSGDDINGDGKVNLYDYSDAGKLSESSDIWLTEGYLILNFDITAYNDGIPVLNYSSDNGGKNMWQTQGFTKKTYIDVNIPQPRGSNGEFVNAKVVQKDITDKLIDGDIAIVDLRYDQLNKYTPNLFLTN